MKNHILIFLTILFTAGLTNCLTPVEMITNNGYSPETHYITTEDGYILTYHRILPKVNTSFAKGRSFLVNHGLFSSSADFLPTGNRSLAFMLADAGYDVWLANARGNAFSRNHTSLNVNADKSKFYKFSWHEIGYYDLASAIDYILHLKNERSLYFAGHSQGTTTLMVLTSTRPEYNKKIRIAHLLSPAALMGHTSNMFSSILSQSRLLEQLEKQLYEVPFLDYIRKIGPRLCASPQFRNICISILSIMQAATISEMDTNLVVTFLENFPSNVSLRQVIHFVQLIKSGKFAWYDYGPRKNLKHYGAESPPAYDFYKIDTPLAIYYGAGDTIVDSKDVKELISKLPNVVFEYLAPRRTFNHLDFIIAKDAVLLYQQILNVTKYY